jgi:hypothetical protein
MRDLKLLSPCLVLSYVIGKLFVQRASSARYAAINGAILVEGQIDPFQLALTYRP